MLLTIFFCSAVAAYFFPAELFGVFLLIQAVSYFCFRDIYGENFYDKNKN